MWNHFCLHLLFVLVTGSGLRRTVPQLDVELEAARDLWTLKTLGLPSTYNFQYVDKGQEASGWLIMPYKVRVRDDVVTDVTPVFSVRASPLAVEEAPTIPRLFDMIESAWNTNAPVIEVEFHEQYGFPTKVRIEQNDGGKVDLEIQSWTLYSVLQIELEAARYQWDLLGGPDYSFTTRVFCHCDTGFQSPTRIQVQESGITAAIDIRTGIASSLTYPTVPELFDIIQNSMDGLDEIIRTDYDSIHGYPTYISISPQVGAVDDAWGFDLWDFCPSSSLEDCT